MEESVGSETEPRTCGQQGNGLCGACGQQGNGGYVAVVTEETAVSRGDQGLPGSVVPGRMWLCIYRSSGSGVCCGLSSLSVRCHLVSLSCLFELVLSLPVCEGVWLWS